MKCKFPIGILNPHECGRKTDKKCSKCGMPVCNEHLVMLDDKPYCFKCAESFFKEKKVKPNLTKLGASKQSYWYYQMRSDLIERYSFLSAYHDYYTMRRTTYGDEALGYDDFSDDDFAS